MAILCARLGDQIAILDKNEKAAKETSEQAISCGATNAIGLACDVTNEAQIEHAFAQIYDQFGAAAGIFASAGIDIGGLIHEVSLEQWRRVIENNVTGVFLVCKYALRYMLDNGVAGSIVCASSPAASVAFAGGSSGPYSASKGAISALVRCMAVDYAPRGIRINAIVPGATETGRWAA